METAFSRDVERSVSTYFHAFGPSPDWDELVWWPPDVFALGSLVLDHAEAYRFVVAPPRGRRWPPLADWGEQVCAAAGDWRGNVSPRGCEPPALVRRCWDTISRDRNVPLASFRSGEAWDAIAALLTLHAIADEACAEVSRAGRGFANRAFESRAWALLQERGSLARLSPTRVRIVPKGHFSSHGITIRSLSKHLALCYESVEVRWRAVEPGPAAERGTYNMLLVPWPLSVRVEDFRPAPSVLIENMDTERFGFFEFDPDRSLDLERISSLLEAAVAAHGRVDAVIFPEAAVDQDAVAGYKTRLPTMVRPS